MRKLSFLFGIILMTLVLAGCSTEHTVIFKDYDGTILKETVVEDGSNAVRPVNPKREGYDFIGWDTSFREVTEDLNIIAEYEKISAYDELTLFDKLVFDAFILNINSFYNPSEVRFLGFNDQQFIQTHVFVKVQGTNRLGGTITKSYRLQLLDDSFYEMGYMREGPDFTIYSDRFFDAEKLNRALIEYWEDKGI